MANPHSRQLFHTQLKTCFGFIFKKIVGITGASKDEYANPTKTRVHKHQSQ